jgi:beta-aspartyl-peptidase (threonine type)
LLLAVHGGAGAFAPQDDPARCREGCERAAAAAYALLQQGAPALEAVVLAVQILEDDPVFNAGTGAALTLEGEVEADAMLMDGRDLRVGAVAVLRAFKNPILVARSVMEQSPHVLLTGRGATRFALDAGHRQVDPVSLITDHTRARLREDRTRGGPGAPGTVGAIALDAAGNIAVATSTGGVGGQYPGRVGDTPLPGCGAYASNGLGAAAATGGGEAMMRLCTTKACCDRMGTGESAQRAAEAVVAGLDVVGGQGGVIAVSPRGELGMAYNTARMARAWVDGGGAVRSGFERT